MKVGKTVTNFVELILLLLLLVGYFFFQSNFVVGLYDEGLIYAGAFRVMHGDVPSLDFYTVYGPGQYYIVAYLFELFGNSIISARIYNSFVLALVVVQVYRNLKLLLPKWIALSGTVCALAFLTAYQLDLYPVNVVLLFSLICSCSLNSYLILGKRNARLANVSIWLGVTVFFRYDIALALFGYCVLTVIYYFFFLKKDAGFRSRLYLIATTISIISIGPIIAVLYLTWVGVWIPAIRDIITYNSSNYVTMRSLPFPKMTSLLSSPVNFISIYLPLIAVFFAAIACCFLQVKWKTLEIGVLTKYRLLLVGFSVLTLAYFAKGWVRTQSEHMLLADIPSIVLLFFSVYLIGRLLSANWQPKLLDFAHRLYQVVLFFVVLFVLTMMIIVNYESYPLWRFWKNLKFDQELPSLGLFIIPQERKDIAIYIKNNTSEKDNIHSATGRHDKIFINDALVYFLAERMPASRWHHYEPGVQTSSAIQKRMISEVLEKNVPYIFVDSSWDNVVEPNGSSKSSNVNEFDDFIQSKYVADVSIGSLIVYRKNKMKF